ncbi:MAG: transglycosylase SLT domain-containing protein [Burkholderiaceae bacterium]|nr:transglycosylase SLT domain-containing protein [Burkholderiaceae bacterium]
MMSRPTAAADRPSPVASRALATFALALSCMSAAASGQAGSAVERSHAASTATSVLEAPGVSVPGTAPGYENHIVLALERAQRAQILIDRGVRLEHAEGVERDFVRAHALYCAAARLDHVDALLRLGWMYANGRGVARDDSSAHALFRRAGELGSELGARLAQSIRGPEDRLPRCMTPPSIVAEDPVLEQVLAERRAPAEAVANYGPTPVFENPAQFRPASTSAEIRRHVALVVEMAREFRLDPRLVFALIRVESGFDARARSPKNAQGLMQLIPETAERFAVRDVWNPAENLRGGMSYLRWLLSYFRGDVVLTLAAYNAGEGAVDRYRGVPPFSETLAYVQRIRAMYPFDRHAFDPRIAADNPPTGPKRIAGAGNATRAQ